MSVAEEMSGVRGAKVQTWKATNPRQLLKRIIEENPGSDRVALLHIFRDTMWREDEAEDYVDVIVEYWFANNYHSLVGPQPVADRVGTRRRTADMAERISERLTAKIAEEAKIALLEMVLPNGKQLRQCSGAECKAMAPRIGGWLSRVAGKVGSKKLVGDVLTEESVRELY